ncbi:Amino acid adenylation [Xenorhabdus ishibashii]|uniref:Amino acid adenylation n=1 Tax=Xenorhabdus ishibashii TaxID=1034471 RepID=A0A2D0KC43_9GAMM|nr:Amino acid adenylation [Xenorhabdus ishibashii]
MTKINMSIDDLKRAVLEKRIEEQLKARGDQPQLFIKPADRHQSLPLSFAQQRLWFISQLDPAASQAYHLPVTLRLTGQLDHHALKISLDRLIARHESLRTRFVLNEGQPCQHIDPADIGFALSYHDLRPLDPALHTQRVAELIDLEAQAPFDFSQGPLIRGQLLQLTDEEHVLLLTLHHIITDGWSVGVLVQELGTFYRAALDGHDDLLPPLPIQYVDYAIWQQEQQQSAAFTEQRDFWCAQLADAPALLTLPTDRPRPKVQTYVGNRVPVHINADLLVALKKLGQRHHTSLFMTVLSAWSLVLARLSGQDDIVIGTPVANRPHHELEGLIGFFVNTLALRVTFHDDFCVADLLAQVRGQALAAYAHQDLPFEQVVEALQPERSLSYNPIFQVMLALNNTPAQELILPGLQLATIPQELCSAHFDLTLSLSETEAGLAGELEYATDLFDTTTIERMVGYLTNVLTAMAADETQLITTLPLLPASERQQLLVDFNATHADFPQEALIHQLFEAQAAQHPDTLAVVCEDQTLSYGELNHRANQLAHYLIALGVRPDDRVAICTERSLDTIVGLLAILKAGGAYVPLDPAYPAERLAFMLDDAAPVVLLTQTTQSDKLHGTVPATVPVIMLDTLEMSLATQPAHNPQAHTLGLTSHHLAYIIYTSGSTGQPKGVMVEHRNVLRLIINSGFADIAQSDCVAHCANVAFDASTWEIWSALLNGARLQVVPQSVLLEPVRFCHVLIKGQVTALWLTAGLFNEYLDNLIPLFGQLRYLLVGGDVLDPSKIQQVQLAVSQPAHLINGYGPTETTTFATTYAITSPVDVTHSIPVGRPIANTQIYILDTHGQPVPVGVTGEIHIAGDGVARGYLNRPELTAERFLVNPFSSEPDARMYRTGDLGRWLPDGNIEYLGRNDFQVKLRGFRIELGEIESRLTQCDGVREAVVIAREDGSGQKQLIAYLRPEEGVELVPTDLRQQLAQHLADYMLPSAFVTLEAFPLTPNGKLDRQALPAPDLSAVVVRSYEAPVGETEIALAQIWQDLLGLEQVGRHDHFFELGGHSLMIVSLIEELRHLGWQLEVRSVFASPVLTDMALAIQHEASTFIVPPNLIPAGCTAITPEMLSLVSLSQSEINTIVGQITGGANNVQDIYPLAPLQEGILFHHLLQTQGDTYLLQSLLAFDSRNRLDSFLDALQQVINRHDILRTSIFWQGLEKPVQVVWRQAPLSVREFTPATMDAIPAQLQAYTDPRQHRINLNHAPLFAADIAHDPVQNEWLLALRFHHLVSDHMTLELILAEIARILQGKTKTLPTMLPYRNFIAQTLSVPAAEHEAYFRAQLADIDEPTAPFGILSVPSDNRAIAEHRLPIDATLAKAIRSQARRLGVSPSILFHVGWAQVLAKTSGRDDVVFGSVLLGRLQGGAGANQILGMFINTLPLRISLNGRTVSKIVQETYHNLTALLEHEQAPLVLAQRCSGVEQPMPLFSTLLNYRHSPSDKTEAVETIWTGIRTLTSEENTNYPITLSVDDLGDGFQLTAQTVTEIAPERITAYLATAISSLIDALVHNPQQRLRDIPILPAAERQQVLTNFNATQTDFPQEALIHQLVEEQAATTPSAIAVVCDDQSLSYEELNRYANRLAHYLIELGVHPDDRVAICVERSLEMVVGLLAILKAGGAYVPLDPAYPTDRLAYMLEDAAPVVLLTQATLHDKLDSTLPVILLDNILNSPEPFLATQFLATQSTDNPDTQALGLTSRHLAYVLYTSGSTGLPKGVMNEHRGVVNRLLWAQEAYQLTPQDRVLQKTPFSFDVSVWEFFLPLMFGAQLVMARPGGHKEPHYLLEEIENRHITTIHFVPSMLQIFLHYIPAGRCLSLRQILCSGEALPYALQQHCLSHLPHSELHNLYGPTEAAIDVTAWKCVPDRHTGQVPIGHPISNIQIYILDTRGEIVPIGVAGEIYIGGVGVARGYLNRPELTAERFVPDPFSITPHARMYKTGDLGRWLPDGNIEYLGRNDFQVKLRGFRIELGEIESRLTQCDGVREAVVLAREDDSGQKRLVAYLRPEEGVELVPADLRQQLTQHLADYMVPSAFVILASFPLTPNGKLDRQALPAPDLSAVVARRYEAPVGETEIALAQIWQKLLSLKQVGRHDHFFELGGHSLMIVSLVEELRQLGWQLEVRSVFASPILTDMALAIQHEVSTFVVPPNRIPEDCTAITPDMLPLVSLSQSEINTIVEQIPGGARHIQDIYPLSPLQEGILFHHLLQTQGDNYLLRSLLAFATRDRLDSFLDALQQIINRHDILRTAIYWQGLEQPVQVVWRQAPLTIREFTPATMDDIPAQLLAHTDPRRHRIDLNHAPLFAADITHDPAQNEWLLALRFHHLVSDHMTLELIFAEIALILQANTEKLPAVLPYRNFIAQTLNTPTAEHEAYFRARLADIDEPTAPFGVLDVQTDNDLVTKAHLTITPDLAKDIRIQARRLGVSPSVLFHVAWAQVLAHTCGRDDVVFGSVLLGRLQGGAGAGQTLGMFINTLPLRISLSGRTVQETVQETYHNLTTLLEHEQAPLVLAQRCSGVEQPMPLFSTLFNYRHGPSGETEVVDTIWAGIRILTAEEHTNYPITLSVDDLGDGFQLTALTVTDIVPEQINAYLATAISGLVDALVHNPQQAIRDIPVLPASERQQLLVDFNATQADFPQEALIHQLFEAQAAQHPEAIAVVFEAQTLSYGELNHRANQLAHYLITLGVRPDDRVALCAERSPEMVIGLLAILKAGGAYVPLDPAYPAERLVYMLEDAAPVALLTQAELAKSEWLTQFNALPTLLLDNPEPCLTTQPTGNPEPHTLGLASRHLAYVIYTSGSTGQPKGVMIEHQSLCNLIATQQPTLSLTADSRVLQFASNSFDASIWECCMALMAGARLCLAQRASLLPGAILSGYLADQAISHVLLSPTALAAMDSLPDTLQTLLVGGEACPPTLVKRWSSGRQMLNAYGPTEITVCATLYSCASSDGSSADNPPPIGRPIANTRIYILDAHGQPVPRGVAGEIYIAGAGVARGYLNRPELTAERFLADPFSSEPDARMYKTGDLGRWLPDGNIEYLGRNDFQVKLRGFRIELGEIESRLSQCDGVREAVVIAREDETGQKQLIAYLRPEEGVELVPADLRQQLAQHLADYMLPSAFVTLEAFPLTPNGKLDRQALPAPDLSAIVTRGYEAPVGETEIALAQIWQDLLGLEQVGRHDHFFELGGHSLLAVQLTARVRQLLARELPLQQLFEQPVLTQLAQTLTNTSTITQVTIPLAERNQPLPLSFAQQRLWFLGQLDPAASLAYHIPVALRLTGRLNRHALTRALDHLVTRHESLRTRVVLVSGQPCQHIDPADIGFALTYQDLRQLDPALHTQRVTELANLEAQVPFDFAQGPLIRGQLLQLADEEHILLLTQHHIISDGWSIGVLIHEISVLYRAILDGQDNPLPPLPIQYADYAVWQREWLQEATLAAQHDFWCTQLAGAPALLTLPTDRPRPAVQTFVGDRVSVRIDVDLLAALKELGQRHNTTLFMTVLSAWSLVLARLSGQDDIVIGTPIANRPHHELEGLIGFFVNTLALRVTFHDDFCVADLLAQVRERALAAYAHQDLPFEQVVEALQPERNLSYSPIFQVMLTLNNTPTQTIVLPEIQCTPVEQMYPSAHFDLTLSLIETEDGLLGDLEYATDLFDTTTIERMVGYLTNVLTAMTADETQLITTLPLLPASECQQLLVDFNATQADFPQEALIHQLFEAQAAQHPEAIAVVFEAQTLSYGELNHRANQLAHYLITLGVRPDDRVALCAERSPEMVIGLLAILKAGGAYVPLDPTYPAERLVYMLEDAAPVALLTQTKLAKSEWLTQFNALPTVLLDNPEPRLTTQPTGNPEPHALGLASRHLAYVIYTSGSTGQPKGVMIEHQSLCNLIATQQPTLSLTADSRVLQFASNSFDASIWECCMALMAGARLCLAQRASLLPGAILSGYLADQAISHVLLSPTALAAMDSLPDTLQTLLVGGKRVHQLWSNAGHQGARCSMLMDQRKSRSVPHFIHVPLPMAVQQIIRPRLGARLPIPEFIFWMHTASPSLVVWQGKFILPAPA